MHGSAEHSTQLVDTTWESARSTSNPTTIEQASSVYLDAMLWLSGIMALRRRSWPARLTAGMIVFAGVTAACYQTAHAFYESMGPGTQLFARIQFGSLQFVGHGIRVTIATHLSGRTMCKSQLLGARILDLDNQACSLK